MFALHEAPSAALSPSLAAELRRLLDRTFEGEFSDHDWDHAVGGVHVWVSGPDGVVSHGSVVERSLVCGGRALRVGYVEAVATAVPHRRQGHGARVMTRLGELIRERFDLGALSTGTPAFYRTVGWTSWRGATLVAGPRGLERTPNDDGDIMILPTPRTPPLDLDLEIVADWRAGDVW